MKCNAFHTTKTDVMQADRPMRIGYGHSACLYTIRHKWYTKVGLLTQPTEVHTVIIIFETSNLLPLSILSLT